MSEMQIEILGETKECKDPATAIEFIQRKTSDGVTAIIRNGNQSDIERIISSVSNKVNLVIK